jgi:serine/threonine protein kinase
VCEKKVKLIDFGFSTCIPNSRKIKIFCGTPSYMAPEIVNKVEYSGPPADIWALGVLLYALLNGRFPFKGRTDEELYNRINECDYAIYKHMSRSVRHLLERMMDVDPDTRITAEEILEHKWITDNDWLIQNIFYD